MPIGLHSTSQEMPGPWFVLPEHLVELDRIIREAWNEQCQIAEQTLKAEAEEHIRQLQQTGGKVPTEEEFKAEVAKHIAGRKNNWPYSKRSMEWVLVLPLNRRVSHHTIDEALNDHIVVGQRIEEFICSATANNLDITVKLKAGGGYSQDLKMSVSPSTSPHSELVFRNLDEWARKFRPSAPRRLWKGAAFFSVPVWFIFLLILSFLISPRERAPNALFSEAHQLLAGGLTQDEHLKATELTLAILSKYGTDQKISDAAGWGFLTFLIGGLIASIIMSIPPGNIIGVGNGLTRISRWNAWIKFVFTVVPGFLLLNVVIPLLVNYYTPAR